MIGAALYIGAGMMTLVYVVARLGGRGDHALIDHIVKPAIKSLKATWDRSRRTSAS